MAYGMGQLRYGSSSQFVTDQSLSWTGEHFFKGNSNTGYQDYRIKKNGTIDADDMYLLHCDIARNSSYDMTFDLKLCNTTISDNSNLEDFQNIRRFTVGKDANSGIKSVAIILFESTNGEDEVRIIKNYFLDKDELFEEVLSNNIWKLAKLNGFSIDKNYVYRTKNDNYYYCTNTSLYNNTTGGAYIYWKKIEGHNIQLISESWKQQQSTGQRVSFDFVIRNNILNRNNNTYNTIIFDMVRQDWDKDIVTKNGDEEYYGLKADISWKIYKFTDIVESIDKGPLSTIGVWGRPDLIMAINGEEIRVGQSGYYELTDFDIQHLGIAALTDKDRFTLDYQYKLSG